MSWYKPADVGLAVRAKLADVGHGARLFARLLALLGASLRRFGLVRDQILFLGNYSLAIIAVSGVFVGFVMGLQYYYGLQRFGAAESVGMLISLSLVREFGPVLTALLFAGRAGTSLTAEIGLMKAGEQLSAMEMMAVDPVQRILAPRFWGGVIAMPVLAAVFSAVGILGGWLVGVGLIGIDGGGTGTRARITELDGQWVGQGEAGPAGGRDGQRAMGEAGLHRDERTACAHPLDRPRARRRQLA